MPDLRRVYVVVSGPPASGKTTLARALASQLGLPLFSKDTIKEAMVEILGAPSIEESRRIGGAAISVLVAVAGEAGRGVVESVWRRTLSRAELGRLEGTVVEVFCRCPPEVARARYLERAPGRGTVGHFDAEVLAADDDLGNGEAAEPIAGPWPVVEVDTERPVEISKVARLVRRTIVSGSDRPRFAGPRPPTTHSLHLRAAAGRIVEAFDRHIPPRAVLLAGSAGSGCADDHSDLDLILYYDVLPGHSAIDAVRGALGAGSGPGSFTLEGVECQVGAMQVDYIDRRIDELLAGKEPDSAPHQKVAEGLLHGLALRDDGLIAGWRGRLAGFPDALAEAMAEHHLKVFAYWSVQERISRRDAALFELQSLLDGAFHVLGALSAANRLYFTSAQFKRMREHVAALEVAPPNLADRLESLFELDRPAAAEELRQLVAETVTVVESRLPQVDTAAIRQALQI